MGRVVIVVELVDEKELKVTGPLNRQSDLCARMLKEAAKVAESYGEPKIVMANDSVFSGAGFVELTPELENYQIKKRL